jgi:hypothetical protein
MLDEANNGMGLIGGEGRVEYKKGSRAAACTLRATERDRAAGTVRILTQIKQ